MDDAACAGTPTELWFPAGKLGPARDRLPQRVIGICLRCPVRRQCADTAVKQGHRCGIWAGIDLGDAATTRPCRDEARDRRHTQLVAVAQGVQP